MIVYCFNNISPVKISISKLLFEKSKDFQTNEIQIIKPENGHKLTKRKSKVELIDKEETAKKINFPPKKGTKRKSENNDLNKSRNKSKSILEKVGLIDNAKNKKKNLTVRFMKKNIRANNKKNTKKPERKDKNNPDIFKIKQKRNLAEEKVIINQIETIKKLKENKSNINFEIKDENIDNNSLKFEDLDDYELNNLDYIPAYEIDKRSFLKTYWSVLLREHIALITFFSWNDYNLFYAKIDRFLIQFCTNMAMNGLFFSDETMHNLYVNNGENSFVEQIPQMLYSLIIGHVLEVILCYLSLTDTPIYLIKELSKKKENAEKIIQILKCVRIKLVIFFVFTFLLFLFCWYFISAFCAVYRNTQHIFIKDTLISFLTSMVDPFITYAALTFIRIISLLRCGNKKLSFIYAISQFFPIF